jgi:selenocysteine-specific elongation factor
MIVDRNITLGTAGHIDHGKTALVKSLTGCETDRLKEEKERGMSIELGFAPCTIADMQVGIVDVPGHENFVRTMVAGASGMDGVMLVVAADDGVMPQTREHLDILTLLGIEHGLVALTKVDRVSPEQVELAQAEIGALLHGTFLEGAPILPISNVTGEGFDAFYESLLSLVQSIRPKHIDGVFRLPVERAFSVKGYGTVVAGIPVSGTARAGDEIVLLPSGIRGRIKRIEVYCRASDAVMAGQCAAINVGHWEHDAIRRGDVLTAPGFFASSEWYTATLRLLPRVKVALKNGTEVKFHTGTAEVIATIYAAGGERIQATSDAQPKDYLVQLRAKTPVVAGPGDHFILRTLSPVETVGGGMIIEAATGRLKRNRPLLVEDLRQRAEAVPEERRFVEYCVRRAAGLAAGPTALAERTKIPHGRLEEILAELVRTQTIIPIAAGLYLHRDTAAESAERLLELVRDFHRRSPESPGLALEQLRPLMPMDKGVLDHLLVRLKNDGRLVERSQRLAATEHRSTFRDADATWLEAIESLFRDQPFQPPNAAEVAQRTRVAPDKVEKLLKILREHERLVQVEKGLLFHCDAVQRAREVLLAHLQKEGRLESVDFKYLLDTTRKFAIPLLDYFDRQGIMCRVGNTRFPKNAPPGGGKR